VMNGSMLHTEGMQIKGIKQRDATTTTHIDSYIHTQT
jgi:preprotein translocase subunit SecY